MNNKGALVAVSLLELAEKNHVCQSERFAFSVQPLLLW